MLPLPTRSAIVAFAGSVSALLLAFAAGSPTALLLGASMLWGLGLALALTVPVGARLRRERLEFAWWHSHAPGGSASALAGSPFQVRCYLRNRGQRMLRFTSLLVTAPDALRQVPDEGVLLLPPQARTEFELSFVPAACGRVVLQGLSVTVPGPFGLFEAPLYFPNPLAIKVLPRSAARTLGPHMTVTGLPVERTGQSLLRRPGGGTELREIREHQPGDPFKAIAWKASGRAGKLMVRDVEREVQETVYILLDISGSMRGGAPGKRKLDLCIEIAALKARQALDRGDRVALITVDGRVVAHVGPGEGLPQMIRIYDALLRATEVVDADLTETDDDELASLVGRYLRHQDGLDLRAADGSWDLGRLVQHARRALQGEPETDEVAASDAAHATLRLFCRLRGIPLRYRADTKGFAKAAGLTRALMDAGARTRMPRSILVMTDFDGVMGKQALTKTLRMLMAHQHALVFLLPDAQSFTGEPQDQRARDLREVYAMQEERRLREARALLGKMGIPLLVCSASDTPNAILGRVQRARRAA